MIRSIKLKDQTGEPDSLRCAIHADEGGVWLGFDGYGDSSSKQGGFPVGVEYFDGVPRVLVWADINNDEPTHIISLARAREQHQHQHQHQH